MQFFFYLFGVVLWLYVFLSFFIVKTVFQETGLLLVAINGTLMIVGAALIGALNRLQSGTNSDGATPRDSTNIQQTHNSEAQPALSDGGHSEPQATRTLIISGALITVPLLGFGAWLIFSNPQKSEGDPQTEVTESYPPTVTGSARIDGLIAEFYAADIACGEGDDAACTKRDKEIGRRLNSLGWCSGNKGRPESEYAWHLCDKMSRRF